MAFCLFEVFTNAIFPIGDDVRVYIPAIDNCISGAHYDIKHANTRCPAVREKSGKFQTWQKSGKSQGILLRVREKMNIGKSQGICIWCNLGSKR